MKTFYILPILAIVIVFAVFIFTAPVKPKIVDDSTKQLITQFTKSGEYIGFDVDPTPPVSKYTYQPKQVIRPVVLPNGTVINQTSTVYEEVEQKEISTLSVEIQDRLDHGSKICKFGYQCDITGMISLIDPTTNKKIPPPYSFLITLDCDYRDFCNLSPSRSSNEVTYPDGSFKYTWVPAPPVNAGEYRATIYVTSHYTNEDGENERRLAVRTIQVIN